MVSGGGLGHEPLLPMVVEQDRSRHLTGVSAGHTGARGHSSSRGAQVEPLAACGHLTKPTVHASAVGSGRPVLGSGVGGQTVGQVRRHVPSEQRK